MSTPTVVSPVAAHMFASNEQREIASFFPVFFPLELVRSASPALLSEFIYVSVTRVGCWI